MCRIIKKRCVFFYWDLCLIFISLQMSFIRQQEKEPKENRLLVCSINELFVLYFKEGEN